MKTSNSKSQLIPNNKSKISDKHDHTITTRTKTHNKITINPKDNISKPTIRTKDHQEITTIKKQQLYTIIETFYHTLCDLPLQKLISSGQPDLWLCEQEATLGQLNKKLNKFTHDSSCEYYRWKLNSVESILCNIKENMSMMARINHLKNYYSGTDSSNYRSRTSSSCQSQRRDVKLGDLANIEHKTVHQLLSYDQYIIKQEKLVDQNPSIQIQAQTVNSQSEQSMSRSQFFSKNKETKRQRLIPKDGENRNAANFTKKIKTTEQETHYNSRQLKDKTLSKAHIGKSTHSQRTISNYTVEGRFLEDKILNGLANQIKSVQRSRRENQQTVQSSKLDEGNTMNDELSKDNNMGEYVEMIKELRCQLINKDKQIERLLINQQQYDEAMEMMKEREKNKNKQIMFLKENISNSNREKEKLSQEIKRLLEFQEQLKDTIRFERERNKKDEQQMQKLQEKYEQQTNEKEQLRAEIDRLNQQNKQSRKNLRVMKEKLEVYSKKYFMMHEQVQTYKLTEKQLVEEICELRNGCAPSRYEQIRDLIEYHKQAIADDSEL